MPYIPYPGPVATWRGVINRNLDVFERIAPKFFWPGEECYRKRDEDGLGVWFGVVSPRPIALLQEIKNRAFPSFGFHDYDVVFDGRRHWAHFRVCIIPNF